MNDRQWEQVQEQLPQGAQVLRAYRAFEGDLRVIARLTPDAGETRYTVRFEDDYPRIELMP